MPKRRNRRNPSGPTPFNFSPEQRARLLKEPKPDAAAAREQGKTRRLDIPTAPRLGTNPPVTHTTETPGTDAPDERHLLRPDPRHR